MNINLGVSLAFFCSTRLYRWFSCATTFLTLVLFFSFIGSTVSSQEQAPLQIKTEGSVKLSIKWATPLWEKFTEGDHSGLYDLLMPQIFAQCGATVERVVMPWRRAMLRLKSCEVDMIGGMDKHVDFHQSDYAIFHNTEQVIYYRESIESWQGIDSLRILQGSWVRGYVDSETSLRRSSWGLTGFETNTRLQAIEMMMKRRTDYYIDNSEQLKTNLHLLLNDYELVESDFTITTLEDIQLFMSFPKTARGLVVKYCFDQGYQKLLKNGVLQKAFYAAEIKTIFGEIK